MVVGECKKEKIMKKCLVMLLVLCMASLANAGIVDVVAVGIDTNGDNVFEITNPTQTQLEGVSVGDAVHIALVLQDNDSMTGYGAGYPSYDGYYLSSMNVSLAVSGPGTLAEKGATIPTQMKHHASFGAWSEPEPAVVGNAIAALVGTGPAIDGIPGAGSPQLVWNLKVTVGAGYDGTVAIPVDLSLNGTSSYADGPVSWDIGYSYKNMVEADLGDLVIGVPEPMTMALLGLGGLALIRRRR
jgi:hypothetical protein